MPHQNRKFWGEEAPIRPGDWVEVKLDACPRLKAGGSTSIVCDVTVDKANRTELVGRRLTTPDSLSVIAAEVNNARNIPVPGQPNWGQPGDRARFHYIGDVPNSRGSGRPKKLFECRFWKADGTLVHSPSIRQDQREKVKAFATSQFEKAIAKKVKEGKITQEEGDYLKGLRLLDADEQVQEATE